MNENIILGNNMRKISVILVCVDGSPYSLRAAEMASVMAKNFGAKVQLLFVIGPAEHTMLGGKEVWSGESENIGDMELNPASEVMRDAGVEYSKDIDFGHPVEKILERAEGADMIVMGTRGKSAMKMFSWGSVSMRVSQQSKVPVMIVP
jgi:nucleotide-binding universal stress UspA family protein